MKGDLVTVYLKGGGSYSMRLTDWAVTRNGISQTISKFTWTAADRTRIPYLDLQEVAAIVVHP